MKKSKEQISNNMRSIKSKDSAVELALRKLLWNKGYRYRKNVKNIFGKPDIAFISSKVAIFCDGEFWHGYNWEERKNDFKSNQDFWIPKIEKNMERDKLVTDKLTTAGWIVLRFSDKEIKKNPLHCLAVIENVLENRRRLNEI